MYQGVQHRPKAAVTHGTITRWTVAPYENSKPIYYEFTACPAAEFAKRFGFADIMPALCNVDYASMELLHAKARADDHLRGRLPMRLYHLRR